MEFFDFYTCRCKESELSEKLEEINKRGEYVEQGTLVEGQQYELKVRRIKRSITCEKKDIETVVFELNKAHFLVSKSKSKGNKMVLIPKRREEVDEMLELKKESANGPKKQNHLIKRTFNKIFN